MTLFFGGLCGEKGTYFGRLCPRKCASTRILPPNSIYIYILLGKADVPNDSMMCISLR